MNKKIIGKFIISTSLLVILTETVAAHAMPGSPPVSLNSLSEASLIPGLITFPGVLVLGLIYHWLILSVLGVKGFKKWIIPLISKICVTIFSGILIIIVNLISNITHALLGGAGLPEEAIGLMLFQIIYLVLLAVESHTILHYLKPEEAKPTKYPLIYALVNIPSLFPIGPLIGLISLIYAYRTHN